MINAPPSTLSGRYFREEEEDRGGTDVMQLVIHTVYARNLSL
jgi:hypothetical protein